MFVIRSFGKSFEVCETHEITMTHTIFNMEFNEDWFCKRVLHKAMSVPEYQTTLVTRFNGSTRTPCHGITTHFDRKEDAERAVEWLNSLVIGLELMRV